MFTLLPRRWRAVLLGSVLALPLTLAPARAADVTEAQAQDVARQLRGWLAGLLGGAVPIPEELFRVTPAGEQYRLTIPLPLPVLQLRDQAGQPMDAVSWALRPLGGTRWAIEDMRLPSALSLTPEAAAGLAALAPLQPGAGQGEKPSKATPGARPPAAKAPPPAPGFEASIRRQSAHGVYDTALQSESRLEMTGEGISMRSTGLGQPGQRDEVTIDRYAGVLQLRPAASGGVDTISDWTMEGYASVIAEPTFGEIKIASRRVHVRGEIGALMTAQITTVLQTAIQLGLEVANPPAAKPPATAKEALEDAARAKLRTILGALKNILAGLTVSESVEGLRVEALGQSGGADRVLFEFAGGAPDGKFAAHMEIGFEGVQVSSLPPRYAELLPRSVSLRPSVGNIDLAALTALADEAMAPKADLDALQGRLLDLLAGNGVTFGLDRLLIDLGATRLTASGNVTAVRPMVAKGEAEIAMTGFDALMERVQKMPEAMQIIPGLALVRGLAKAEKDRLVWRLAMTEDQKVTVNGVDLRVLGGNGKNKK